PATANITRFCHPSAAKPLPPTSASHPSTSAPDRDDGRVAPDLVAGPGVDAHHGARHRRAHVVLGLHRLDRSDDLTGFDGVPLAYGDRHHLDLAPEGGRDGGLAGGDGGGAGAFGGLGAGGGLDAWGGLGAGGGGSAGGVLSVA